MKKEDKIIRWLWMHVCLKYRCDHVKRIIAVFGNALSIYEADEYNMKISGVLTKAELKNFSDKSLNKAIEIYSRCKELSYDIITFGDERYPDALKKLEMPPLVLFVKGDYSVIGQGGVAIVGARGVTPEGRRMSYDYGYDLAKTGKIVVSGGAQGVDTQAHLGALQAGGKTICVLGGGLNHKYLSANSGLRERISRNGLLVSEYPPDFEPTSYTFPKRNRLIAAFSDCTLIIEAEMSSGALITAYEAREQRKPVFALPGWLNSENIRGTDMLIQKGAYSIDSYRDILDWYENADEWDSDSQKLTSEMIDEIRTTGKEEEYKKNKAENNKNDDIIYSEKKKESEEHKSGFDNALSYGKEYYRKHESNTNKKCNDNKKLFNVNEKNDSKSEKKEKTDNFLKDMLTENALSVYDTISETPIYADDIRSERKLETGEVLAALTELELAGLIQSLPNGKFVRN